MLSGGNFGTIKFVLKVKKNRDEGTKLMRIASCEEIMPKLTTCFCKSQVKRAIQIFSKPRLMTVNSKASQIITTFTDQSKIVHSLSKSEMSRLAKK